MCRCEGCYVTLRSLYVTLSDQCESAFSLLTTNHRQAGDKTSAELLNRLRTGPPTDADIDTLRERATVDSSQPPFDTALRIFPTRKQVKEYNNQCFTLLTASQTASPDVYSIAAIGTDICPGLLDS